MKICERGLLILAALALLKFGLVQSQTAQAPAAIDAFLHARAVNRMPETVAIAALETRNRSEAGSSATIDSAPEDFEFGSQSKPDMALWSRKRIAAYRKTLTSGEPEMVAVLTIPSVNVNTPIYNGTGHNVLDRGAGLIKGTNTFDDDSGNVGIAAHRDGFFRGLKDIETGHKIKVSTKSRDLIYRVSELTIVKPEDVHVLNPADKTQITLVTCYPFYFIGNAPERFIVKADLISSITVR